MRLALLLIALAGCSESENPVTGGFREIVVDKTIRHGQQLQPADFDGDGKIDIAVALSLTDAVNVYVAADDGGFDSISISGPGSIVARDLVTLDVDGDADLDVAAVGLTQRKVFGTSAGEVVWYENPGNPRGVWLTHPISRPDLADTSSKSDQLPWGACCIAAGDLDGDGRQDLVVGQRNAADERGIVYGNRIVWYRNAADGFTGPIAIDANLLDVSAVLIADVDGDDRLDVIAGADTGQELAWYHREGEMQGSLRFVKYTIWGEGRPTGIEFSDVDDDGDRELAVAAYTVTASASLAIFEPPAAFDEPWPRTELDTGFGSLMNEAARVAVADFDGDGSTDLAVSSQTKGDLRVYRATGGVYERVDVRGGYNVNSLATADVDGDGRIDLVTSTFELGSRDRIAWWKNESFPQ